MSQAGMASAASKDFAAEYRTSAAPVFKNWGNKFIDFWGKGHPLTKMGAAAFGLGFAANLLLKITGNESADIVGASLFIGLAIPLLTVFWFSDKYSLPTPVWRTLALTDFAEVWDYTLAYDHPLRVKMRAISAEHPEAQFEIEYLEGAGDGWPKHALLWVYESPFESAVRKPVASIENDFSVIIPIPYPE